MGALESSETHWDALIMFVNRSIRPTGVDVSLRHEAQHYNPSSASALDTACKSLPIAETSQETSFTVVQIHDFPSEAWMLCDFHLFRKTYGTTQTIIEHV